MNKIRIIELFNKIANEENLPQRIVYKGVIYNWDNSRYLHYEDKISNEKAFLEGICTEMVLNDYIEILNDEVLEDNTEEIEELTYYCIGNAKSTDQTKMIDKINELVRAIKKLRKEKTNDMIKIKCANCGKVLENSKERYVVIGNELYYVCKKCKETCEKFKQRNNV